MEQVITTNHLQTTDINLDSTQCTATTRIEKGTDSMTETKTSSSVVLKRIEDSLSQFCKRNILTRSMTRQSSRGKYSIADEDAHTKCSIKKTVKSKPLAPSLKKSIAGNKIQVMIVLQTSLEETEGKEKIKVNLMVIVMY